MLLIAGLIIMSHKKWLILLTHTFCASLTACGGGEALSESQSAQTQSIIFDPATSEKLSTEQNINFLSQQNATIQSISTSADASTQTVLSASGPAPALTYLQISSIYSSNIGSENITSSSQSSTLSDHGGAAMYAYVLALGYGKPPYVTMNGAALPTSKILSTAVCRSTSGALAYCNAGQTVIGWMYEINLSGNQNGTFKFQQTSQNSPTITMSTKIYIQ